MNFLALNNFLKLSILMKTLIVIWIYLYYCVLWKSKSIAVSVLHFKSRSFQGFSVSTVYSDNLAKGLFALASFETNFCCLLGKVNFSTQDNFHFQNLAFPPFSIVSTFSIFIISYYYTVLFWNINLIWDIISPFFHN